MQLLKAWHSAWHAAAEVSSEDDMSALLEYETPLAKHIS